MRINTRTLMASKIVEDFTDWKTDAYTYWDTLTTCCAIGEAGYFEESLKPEDYKVLTSKIIKHARDQGNHFVLHVSISTNRKEINGLKAAGWRIMARLNGNESKRLVLLGKSIPRTAKAK